MWISVSTSPQLRRDAGPDYGFFDFGQISRFGIWPDAPTEGRFRRRTDIPCKGCVDGSGPTEEGRMAYSQLQAGSGGAVCHAPAPSVVDTTGQGLARAARAKTLRFEAHDVIFYEGDPADRVYELTEGAVMLYKLLPDGRRQVVEILAPKSLFGLPAGKLQDTNAETLTPATVRVIDRREADSSLDLQCDITRCLLSQIETLHDHAVLLGRKSAAERVASFLMHFVPNRGVTGCAGPNTGRDDRLLTLTMTRQEIADYLGLTIETVSRVISEFKRRGLIIAEKQDRLRITDVCELCQLTGTH
jgi:CRP/FNR family transcriptional regulator